MSKTTSICLLYCVDPAMTAVWLRRIGVLAIAHDNTSVEIHHVSEQEQFAFWFRDHGYKLENYPELAPIIAAYIEPID